MRTSRARASSGTATASMWEAPSRRPLRAGRRSRAWVCAPAIASSCRAAMTPSAPSASSVSSCRFRWQSSASPPCRTDAMRILSVVGARPNFMKLAPVDRELVKRGVEHVIVHTGQHYDPGMSDAFFEQLWIPAPDHDLGVGSGSHAQQTAAVMQRLEPVIVELHPDLVLTYGDVNSTVAAALVAAKLQVRVGHVEAGLRSGDWTMPEEINRVVTDRLSDDAPARFEVRGRPYVVVTLHRPANVDDPAVLRELLEALTRLADHVPVLFPVHPRTRARIEDLRLRPPADRRLRLLEPLAYLDMLSLVAKAGLVVTDSGGLQEETSFLGVPCLTVRPNTERPITCTHGTNRLVQAQRDAILAAAERGLARRSPARPVIERWDGKAAERIARVVCDGERFALDGGPAAQPQREPRRAVAIPQPLAS